MKEFFNTLFKTARRICIIGLAVGILFKFYSTTNAATEFDPIWYAEQNPDVVAELGDSPELLQLHYELFGKTECRMSNSTDVEAKLRKLFNAEEYAVLYPDVVEAFGDDPEILFEHYVSYGILESRRASEDMRLSTVASLKAALTSAVESIGAEAVPGSVAIMLVMEGSLTEDAAVQNAFVQVQDALVDAVETTVVAASKPEPVVTESDDDDDDEDDGGCGSYDDPCGGNHTYAIWDNNPIEHRCSACEHAYGMHMWDSTHKCTICNFQGEHSFLDGFCQTPGCLAQDPDFTPPSSEEVEEPDDNSTSTATTAE